MTAHLLIDGYNLLFSTDLVEGGGDLERLREELLQILERYRAARGHRLTVVFDSARGGRSSTETAHRSRVRLAFSQRGETADEAILRQLGGAGMETIVITSDRALQRSATAAGVVVVGVDEFASRVWETLALPPPQDEDEEVDVEPTLSSRKRGNPRRASRGDRRRSSRLKKL